MDDRQKAFKPPPKRFQPRGLSILYEDRDILIVDKAAGLLTVSDGEGEERTAYFLLNDYVRKGVAKSRNRVFIVHRLDRDTSGLLVFAKHEEAKRFLQDGWSEFQKKYYAVVQGKMPGPEGVVESHLVESGVHKVYSVDDPTQGKFARTGYRVLKETPAASLLEIELFTGRKHQIRVHLADLGCPVAGDKRYGSVRRVDGRLALHAGFLAIDHPFSKERMTFTAALPAAFDGLVKGARKICDARTGAREDRPHREPVDDAGRKGGPSKC